MGFGERGDSGQHRRRRRMHTRVRSGGNDATWIVIGICQKAMRKARCYVSQNREVGNESSAINSIGAVDGACVGDGL